ncbi:MAG: DUF4276 family protein [Desulfomonilaceae bacterium]
MSIGIVPIVEGYGEADSVQALLNRILQSMNAHTVHSDKPFRQKRQRIIKQGELERAIESAIRKRRNVGAILVLLDADRDCPAILGPELLTRARNATSLPVKVVLAKMEFESWFLGSLESFRGFMGVPDGAVAPENPEAWGKGRLERICKPVNYRSTVHQLEFVRGMDIDACRRRCPSFDKLCPDVDALVHAST